MNIADRRQAIIDLLTQAVDNCIAQQEHNEDLKGLEPEMLRTTITFTFEKAASKIVAAPSFYFNLPVEPQLVQRALEVGQPTEAVLQAWNRGDLSRGEAISSFAMAVGSQDHVPEDMRNDVRLIQQAFPRGEVFVIGGNTSVPSSV